MEGFFIPSAFTPNKDGKNDFYKPLLLGIVSHYEFSIYNRWGELVFKTTVKFQSPPIESGGF